MDAYILLRAKNGFFERKLQIVKEIVARSSGCTGPRLPPEIEGKEILENIPEAGEDVVESTTEAIESRPPEPFMTVGVIDLSFLSVPQHLIGFGAFLELLLSLFVPGIPVGMALQSQLPIGFLELFAISLSRYTQDFVIIFFPHFVPIPLVIP